MTSKPHVDCKVGRQRPTCPSRRKHRQHRLVGSRDGANGSARHPRRYRGRGFASRYCKGTYRAGKTRRRMESKNDASRKGAEGGWRCGFDGPQCSLIRENCRVRRPKMTLHIRKIDGRNPEGEPLHYTACGLDDVYLVNGFARETVDGEQFTTIENMDGLWKAIAHHLVTKKKVLAPKEIRIL